MLNCACVQFAGLLEQAAPRLLETVLMLLRSKSREVIKAVIGFCKVLFLPGKAAAAAHTAHAHLPGHLVQSCAAPHCLTALQSSLKCPSACAAARV